MLTELVQRVDVIDKPRVLVGVDGAPGTGKSTLGDELARRLATRSRMVVRSTTDFFHRPRVERNRLGRTSAEGYYSDSHDLATIIGSLLVPFASGAREVQVAAFDEPSDASAPAFTSVTGVAAVLIFDGLFLHREELRPHWDFTVFLRAELRRQQSWTHYLTDGLPTEEAERGAETERRLRRARWPRYHDGWQLYLNDVGPQEHADIIVTNDDFLAPVISS